MTEGTETICVQGARVHNLKNIDVEIPRDSLTVITGLSGSGKSSLAFDTIYAEGQRRLYGVIILLRETVSRTDGEAGCREYRRPFSGDFDRSEIYESKSEVDSWNGDGDL